jgi:hypothetical protein
MEVYGDPWGWTEAFGHSSGQQVRCSHNANSKRALSRDYTTEEFRVETARHFVAADRAGLQESLCNNAADTVSLEEISVERSVAFPTLPPPTKS